MSNCSSSRISFSVTALRAAGEIFPIVSLYLVDSMIGDKGFFVKLVPVKRSERTVRFAKVESGLIYSSLLFKASTRAIYFYF